MLRRLSLLTCCLAAILLAPQVANASFLVARNAQNIQLAVGNQGWAMVTFTENGTLKHVLARGAVNANQPKPGAKQTAFQIDWAGGWGWTHKQLWKTFGNACKPYDGPGVPFFVTGCKAPDGSYWALQSWQTALPGLGFKPWLFKQKQWWLHLSHWTGTPAELDVYQDWVYSHHIEEVFGQFTYLGVGVRGYGTTHWGAPTDNYGRLLYLDTHNSKYGRGWRREEAFVTSGPPGIFCFGFFRRDPLINGHPHPPRTTHRRRGPAHGDQYRITAVGPGVTPDIVWYGPGLHKFNPGNPSDVQLEDSMNAKLDEIRGGWRKCHQH
jgi:hypothetical protein